MGMKKEVEVEAVSREQDGEEEKRGSQLMGCSTTSIPLAGAPFFPLDIPIPHAHPVLPTSSHPTSPGLVPPDTSQTSDPVRAQRLTIKAPRIRQKTQQSPQRPPTQTRPAHPLKLPIFIHPHNTHATSYIDDEAGEVGFGFFRWVGRGGGECHRVLRGGGRGGAFEFWLCLWLGRRRGRGKAEGGLGFRRGCRGCGRSGQGRSGRRSV